MLSLSSRQESIYTLNRVLQSIYALIYVLGIVIIVGTSISEIVARIQLGNLLEAEQIEINEQLVVELQIDKVPSLSNGVPEATPSVSTVSELVYEEAVTSLKGRREMVRLLNTELKVIVLTGSDNGETVRSLLYKLAYSLSPSQPGGLMDASETEVFYILRYSRYPSESILAIALIGSSLLGSIVASLRATENRETKNDIYRSQFSAMIATKTLVFGVAAGFITFMAIRGGKSIILLEATDTVSFINPYTGAFAALLAGLFTDRAYNLLAQLVDSFELNFSRVFSNSQGGADSKQ